MNGSTKASQGHHKGITKASQRQAAQWPPVLRPAAVEQDVLQPASRHAVQTVRQPPRAYI